MFVYIAMPERAWLLNANGILSLFGGSMEINESAAYGEAQPMVFIVNPIAGSKQCEELFAKAEARLKERGAEYRVLYSEHPGHSIELAKQAIAEGADYIVAVGGDGTISEVVSVIVGRPGVRFGVLPFGTGNDFASAIGIPTEPEKAADLLLDGKAFPCDLGRVNAKYFTNVAGLGFDVDVLRSVEKHKKGKSGMLPYVIGIVDAIMHRHKIHCFVSLDGGEEEEMDALIITACNGRRFGGGMVVAPEARPDDGLFDICISRWVGFFRLLTLLPLFIKGKHVGKKPIIYKRARTISVRTEGEFTVELDGELIEKTPVTCTVMPGALRVVRPAFN